MEKEPLIQFWAGRFLLVLCWVTLGGLQTMGQYSAPMEIVDARVYFEKFAPVGEFEIQQQVAKIALRRDSAEFLGALVELKEIYNKIIYRKLNEEIIGEIGNFDLGEKVVPIYRRDLIESNDTNIRYVIRNDLNMMEVLISDYDRNNNRKLNFQLFYIEDLKTGEKYRNHTSIYNMLQVLNVHQNFRVGKEKRKPTPSEIENKISRSMAKVKSARTGTSLDAAQIFMAALAFIGLAFVILGEILNF